MNRFYCDYNEFEKSWLNVMHGDSKQNSNFDASPLVGSLHQSREQLVVFSIPALGEAALGAVKSLSEIKILIEISCLGICVH
jgi:hypothetical protein